jgi:hypothetical protein
VEEVGNRILAFGAGLDVPLDPPTGQRTQLAAGKQREVGFFRVVEE